MDEAKRKRLEALGGRVTTVEEFLGLTPEEMAYIELKLALARLLKEVRKEKALTQVGEFIDPAKKPTLVY